MKQPPGNHCWMEYLLDFSRGIFFSVAVRRWSAPRPLIIWEICLFDCCSRKHLMQKKGWKIWPRQTSKIHTLSMSPGVQKNQPKQKSGRAIYTALSAPLPCIASGWADITYTLWICTTNYETNWVNIIEHFFLYMRNFFHINCSCFHSCLYIVRVPGTSHYI